MYYKEMSEDSKSIDNTLFEKGGVLSLTIHGKEFQIPQNCNELSYDDLTKNYNAHTNIIAIVNSNGLPDNLKKSFTERLRQSQQLYEEEREYREKRQWVWWV